MCIRDSHIGTTQVETIAQPNHSRPVRIAKNDLRSHVDQFVDKEETAFEHLLTTRCGDTNKTDYTEPVGHKPSDWIVDKEPTTDSEGSKHKECENCGEKLETAEIEKIYNSGTTDSKGEAVVGGYLVTVTDTDTKNPVANAAAALHKDNSISIRLPNSRLLDYADQTTVTVQLVKDKSTVPDMSISVTDKNDNYAAGKTDKEGQITVPAGSGKTNEDGKVTAGYCLLYTSRCV